MRSTERSLVRRVGWTAAAAAVAASVATLAVAMWVVDYRVMHRAEYEALTRSRVVVREIEAEAQTSPADAQQLQEEVDEFSYGGLTVAVYRDNRWVAGSAAIPTVAEDGCLVVTNVADPWLVCRSAPAQADYFVVVGEPVAQLFAHRQPLLLGGLAALAIVGIGSIATGLFVGRWSLGPLLLLREALGNVDAAVPLSSGPLPRPGLVELDVFADTLADLLGRLDVELQRSRRFASSAAHELRTPLAKLRTELELILERDASHDSEARARLARCVSRAEDLSRLVSGLLLLASPQAALRGATLVSLAGVVEAVVADIGHGADRIQLDLTDDGMVVGDTCVLATVVANAIDNALKYSHGLVRVSVRSEDRDVLLRVDDEGPGLSGEDRDRAFEAFFRAPGQQATAGHGVGLSLVLHAVKAHGGTAEFAAAGRGAHLVVRLPLASPVGEPLDAV